MQMVPFCCVKDCEECGTKQHICGLCGIVNMHKTNSCKLASISHPFDLLKDYFVDVLKIVNDKMYDEDYVHIVDLIIISSPHNTMQTHSYTNKRNVEEDDDIILSKKIKYC